MSDVPLRGRAKLRCDIRMIGNLLQLPEGLHIVHAFMEFDPVATVFLIEGESLEPAPFDQSAPLLGPGHLVQERIEFRGQYYYRNKWELGEVTAR